LLHIAAGVVMFRIPACGLAAGNQMPLPGLGLWQVAPAYGIAADLSAGIRNVQ